MKTYEEAAELCNWLSLDNHTFAGWGQKWTWKSWLFWLFLTSWWLRIIVRIIVRIIMGIIIRIIVRIIISILILDTEDISPVWTEMVADFPFDIALIISGKVFSYWYLKNKYSQDFWTVGQTKMDRGQNNQRSSDLRMVSKSWRSSSS